MATKKKAGSSSSPELRCLPVPRGDDSSPPPPPARLTNSPPLTNEEREYLRRCAELSVQPDPSVLTTLSTRWWFLAPKTYFGDGGLLPLLDVLAESKTITSLTLRSDPNNSTAASHAADARALAQALRRNTSVTTLDVSACGLDDLAITELAAALGSSATIKTAKLGSNAFGDAGTAALTKHLGAGKWRCSCGLQRLDVSNNGLYYSSSHKLATVLSKHGVKIDAVGNYTTEEILNALTHGMGFIAALIGAIPLLYDAWHRDRTTYWACLLYQFTLLCCFGSSTAYHGFFMHPRIMLWFQRFDHAAIYLLIAGSYTPLVFLGCRGHLGAAAIVVINWIAAFCGCCISAAGIGISSEHLNPTEIIIYASMGAAVLPIIGPVKRLLAPEAFFLLALGGALYIAGIFFFVRGMRHPGWHVVWHIFVMAAAATHWFCVYLYILPSIDFSAGGGSVIGDYERSPQWDEGAFSREELKQSVDALMARYAASKAFRPTLPDGVSRSSFLALLRENKGRAASLIPESFSRAHLLELLPDLALASLLFNDTGLLENATRFAKDALHLDEAKSLIARAAEKPRSYRAALRSFFRGEDEATCDAGDCAE
ncbi:hemolysin-like protein [Aureococcus anophagefferens]|uniref:Hemolysin-like protein n=1 Tax=Aureococcus anophagefferens TaxID=44056 RepID=A0ABR1FMT9_AURAN